ncbi:hypothetical protein [Sandaracinus amylolyticus]|uniref:hypothetical protein n=1 Tax=Sandaracinus amylolyticus TaxID=927083 RepID=UPI001F378C90|nr:hypothetical protein [Sandaracinus amylolyticus]UJR82644.1 Hypothetical protein I5071_47090 [Sandaracinus amylolyticus]
MAFVARWAWLLLLVGCSLAHERGIGDDAGALPLADASIPLDARVEVVDAGRDAGLVVSIECDDLDPCTVDGRSGGVCVSRAAPDGTLCDDGDACTLGDRCAAGRCRGGGRSTGPAELVSVSSPAFRGTALGVGDDRFVFFQPAPSGTDVLLTRGTGDRLDPLDELHLAQPGIRAAFWLGAELVAYTTGQHAGLLELTGDRLVARGELHLDGILSASHFAAIGTSLLVCTSENLFGTPRELRVYDARDRAVLVPRGTITIPGGCHALAASSDRARAYVSTGTDTLIVSPTGAVEGSLGVASRAVHVGGGFITLATSDRALLLREADTVEVARVTGRVFAARFTRRGFEVISDVRTAGITQRTMTFYDVDPGAPDPLTVVSTEPLAQLDAATAAEATRWASHDDALLEGQRLFRLGTTPPFLDEIRDPRRFWPGWLRASGTTIFLRDDHSAIAIDASDPAAPRTIAGGELPAGPWVTIEVPDAGEIGLYGARGWWPTAARHRPRALGTEQLAQVDVVVRSFDAAQRPTDHATRSLGDASDLHATYRHLYALERDATGSRVRLRRWAAEQLISGPIEPQLLHEIVSPAGDRIEVVARAHDDDAIAFATTATVGTADLHWVVLDEGRTLAPLRLDIEVHDIAVHGDRAVVMGWHADPAGTGSDALVDDVVFVTIEHRGDTLIELSRTSWTTPRTSRLSMLTPMQLLRFDGRVVYAQHPSGTPEEAGPVVIALRADALSQRIAYPLASPAPIWSASESDVGLVLGGPAGVVVARPWCP